MKTTTILLILCTVISTLTVSTSWAQESVNSTKATAATKPTISDAAWIAGHWQGKGMGGSFEETWNPPMGNSMVGMFKLVQKDKIAFYELMTIVEENDSLMLRLKHFTNKLVGWEEKDKSVEFPLIRITKTEAIFDGLKFLKQDDDTMHVFVKVKSGEKVNEMKFVFNHVKPKRDDAPSKTL